MKCPDLRYSSRQQKGSLGLGPNVTHLMARRGHFSQRRRPMSRAIAACRPASFGGQFGGASGGSGLWRCDWRDGAR